MKKYALGTFAGFPFAIDEVANQNDNDHYLKDAIVGLASDGYSARVILSGVELTYPGNGTTDVSNGVVANNGELYVVTGGNYAGELVANNLNLVIDNSGDESILWGDGQVRPSITAKRYSVTTGAGSVQFRLFKRLDQLVRPYLEDDGELLGIPKSSLLSEETENKLATARAVKLLNDIVLANQAFNSKYRGGYFYFANPGSGNNAAEVPVPWDEKKGSAAISPEDVEVPAGGTLAITCHSGDVLITYLRLSINGTAFPINDGRTTWKNTTAAAKKGTFVYIAKGTAIDLEVQVYS